MHVHGAELLILTGNDPALGSAAHQNAFGGIATIIRRRDADLAADQRILTMILRYRSRLGCSGLGQRSVSTDLAAAAMAKGLHAIHPGDDPRIVVHEAALTQITHEPEGMIRRKIAVAG